MFRPQLPDSSRLKRNNVSYALALIAGVAAGLANIAVATRLPARRAAEFFNMFMAATAAFYFGSALSLGDRNALMLETSISAGLFGLALAGQWSSLKFT